MIAIGSIGKLFTAEGSAAYNFFNTFGNTVLALFMGIIAVGCLICGRKDKVVKKANADGTGCKLTEKRLLVRDRHEQLGGQAPSRSPSALCSSPLWAVPWAASSARTKPSPPSAA